MDYYAQLGLNPEANKAEIKAAYRKLAKVLHPDRNNGDKNATAQFSRVTDAYDILSDDARRAEYDRERLFEEEEDVSVEEDLWEPSALDLQALWKLDHVGRRVRIADWCRQYPHLVQYFAEIDEPPVFTGSRSVPPSPPPPPPPPSPPPSPPQTPRPPSPLSLAKVVVGGVALLLFLNIASCVMNAIGGGKSQSTLSPVASYDAVPNNGAQQSTEIPGEATRSFETSFDCARATAWAETQVCSSQSLAHSDRRQTALYSSVMDRAIGVDRTRLQQSQRSWIRERNSCADVPCIEQSYSSRLSYLESWTPSPVETPAEVGNGPVDGRPAAVYPPSKSRDAQGQNSRKEFQNDESADQTSMGEKADSCIWFNGHRIC